MTSIIDLPDEPKYRIKAVSSKTGIRPVTLRAWERRHAILSPHRSGNKYRVYSERDIAILRWLKSQVDKGVPISTAANELKDMQKNGIWPDALPPTPNVSPSKKTDTPPEVYVQKLYRALIKHDEATATVIMKEIRENYDLNTICMDILTPTLVDIGDAWYHGQIRIATEHFASNFLREKLLALLDTFPTHRNAPYLLVGCAPTEHHEVNSLMTALLLRSKGYHVEYLGADIPLIDLVDYASYEHPKMIILSASMEETALELKPMKSMLSKLRPTPIFGYGGSIFITDPALIETIPGNYLGDTFDEVLENVDELLSTTKKSSRQKVN